MKNKIIVTRLAAAMMAAIARPAIPVGNDSQMKEG